MGDVVKLLLLLCIASATAGKVFHLPRHSPPPAPNCTSDQYLFKNVCFLCTGCGEFMYIKAKCSATENTLCGWCGRKPDMETISDEVLASYQTKCLMANLDFVDMARIKEQLGFADEMKPVALRDSLIYGDLLDDIDSDEGDDNFKAAKESLDAIDDDSAEQELPDPTFKEEIDSSSSEEDKTEEIEDKSGEVVEKQEESDEKEEPKDLEGHIADRVKEHLKLLKEAKALEPKLSDLISLEQVNEGWIQNPRMPVFVESEFTSLESSEDVSNERDIKWQPNWMIDDKIKRIPPQTVVQAEELTAMEYEVITKSEKPRQLILTLKEKQDIVTRLTEEIENYQEGIVVSRPPPPAFLSPIAFAALGFLILVTVLAAAMVQFRGDSHQSFTGVPEDSPDYQLIIDSSKRLEERLAKNEKFANRHVHVNPTFDV